MTYLPIEYYEWLFSRPWWLQTIIYISIIAVVGLLLYFLAKASNDEKNFRK